MIIKTKIHKNQNLNRLSHRISKTILTIVSTAFFCLILAVLPSDADNNRFEKLQLSDRILAKVCNPDSVVGNFANSDQNGRTVSNKFKEIGNATEAKNGLISNVTGVDYTPLQDALVAGKWKEADQITRKLMLKAAKRETPGWLDPKSLDNFSCDDLRIINRLWEKYSQGHFGISVQKQIWLEVGGTLDEATTEKLGERLGWRKRGQWISYDSFNFSLSAPGGHLPSIEVIWRMREYIDYRGNWRAPGVALLWRCGV